MLTMGWKGWRMTWLTLLLTLTPFSHPGWAEEPSKLILVLGEDSYLPPAAVKGWTGAEVKKELGEYEFLEFALVILSNIPYSQIPGAVREGLKEFVASGGSLLVGGGPNAYGSGGYFPLAPALPFAIRAEGDWWAVPFKPVFPLQPGHPILQGVTLPLIGTLNNVDLAPGATELAHYAGGGRFPFALIAERKVGQGTVVATTFELGREVRGGWPDGQRFLQNLLTYLTERSPLKPKPKEKKVQ
jgi:hypothetical protein